MKKNFISLFFALLTVISIAGSTDNSYLQTPETINTGDTVVFDLAQAVINGTFIEIPVFILTDDTINALDFSLKYNHTNLLYDTILDLTTHLSTLSYYNPSDSTIRFTSNSFTAYAKATPLVALRFDMLTMQMFSTDLYTLKGYLNGIACSVKLTGSGLTIGIPTINQINIKIYPSPSKGDFTISSGEFIKKITVFNALGDNVYQNSNCWSQLIFVELQDYENGIYFLKTETDSGSSTHKIILSH